MQPFISYLTKNCPSLKIETSDAILAQFSTDKTPNLSFKPDCILTPQCESDICHILKAANEFKIPIIPRGSGTGTSGGALAVNGGAILNMEAFNNIIEIDTQNRTVTTQPMVITKILQDAVEKKGLFYPPDPASLETCSIGGNVLENAGGPRCLKYGVTGDYVMGLKGVYANGERFKLGGKLYKNVAGYDTMRTLVGSEGTLAIITEITLRLLPAPKYRIDILAEFENLQDALDTLLTANQSGIQPALAEFMDGRTILAAKQFLVMPFSEVEKNAVLFQVDGQHLETLKTEAMFIETISYQYGASTVTVSPVNHPLEYAWKIRRVTSDALKRISPQKKSHDIVVPRACISEFMIQLEVISKQIGITILGYGHLGDGNIHVNFLKDVSSENVWRNHIESAEQAVIDLVLKLGGSITGEHGVGLTKKRFLPQMIDSESLKIMKMIKKSFDPNNILNPGKIF